MWENIRRTGRRKRLVAPFVTMPDFSNIDLQSKIQRKIEANEPIMP